MIISGSPRHLSGLLLAGAEVFRCNMVQGYKNADGFHTFILRGGRWNGMRVTCEKGKEPVTMVLFSHRVNCVGDLYELQEMWYVLADEEDEDEPEEMDEGVVD